jgi:hypothetical protein
MKTSMSRISKIILLIVRNYISRIFSRSTTMRKGKKRTLRRDSREIRNRARMGMRAKSPSILTY